MLIDSRTLPDGAALQADVCIIGGGPAAIVLARELAGPSKKVCLLESGDLEPREETEDLNRGETVGPYPIAVQSRHRCLGGSTHQWGGNCSPFDPIDFERRPHVPYGSWPIGLDQLEPYYERVREYCDLPDSNFDSNYWVQKDPGFARRMLPTTPNRVRTKVYLRRQIRFGESYRESLANSNPHLEVYLNATCLQLVSESKGGPVQRVDAGCLDQKRFTVSARVFILAAGMENPRTLLLSRLGNQHDQVGRYFMGHLNFFSGFIVPNFQYRDLGLYSVHIDMAKSAGDSQELIGGLQVSPQIQRELGILNYAAFLGDTSHVPFYEHANIAMETRAVRRRLAKLRTRIARFKEGREAINSSFLQSLRYGFGPPIYGVRNWVEQAPRPENRITLGETLDPFGLPRMRIHWTLGSLEKRTVIEAQRVLAEEIERAKVGKFFSFLPTLEERWPDKLARSSHHMGTTRMSRDPRDGVVDENCRVHGIDNLFIAGGSVLPTSGVMMVTFNILTLAFRLASHLKRRVLAGS